MKKHLPKLVVALSVLTPFYTHAAVELPEGTQEVSVQGNAKLGSGWNLNLTGSYGYFIKDNWEIGGTATIDAQDANDAFTGKLGVFTEYNFVNSTNWVPYLGAATQLAGLSYDENAGAEGNIGKDGSSWALNIKLAGGLKYFINEHVALSGEINYNIATDDIEFNGDKAEDSITNIIFGTRFYF